MERNDVYTVELERGQISLDELREIYYRPCRVRIGDQVWAKVAASQATIGDITATGRVVYGVNTGFGLLAQTKIPAEQMAALQRNLILSHSAGTGPALPTKVVRLLMVLKVISLIQGFSGVRRQVIEAIVAMIEENVIPIIPAKGSVGASGDLAPLAHMAGVLLGVGEVQVHDEVISAREGLARLGLTPLTLGPKEGLALINGTQASTALALAGLFEFESVYTAAVVTGALSVDALKGTDVPFDDRIHRARGQKGQIRVAADYRRLLAKSDIRHSHLDCERVQDPYSLRCQPQVMGACLDLMHYVAGKLTIEANAVTDNPLVFADAGDVLSGGNFHAEPVAVAADTLALAIAEVGAIAERRLAILVDPHMSGLPAFLVRNSGLNSGFMIAQVTAAALASENKSLAHPASVDSLPTSANQEDHVSMATFAARRLLEMAENSAGIVAIELLAAAQGVEFHRPLRTSPILEDVIAMVREKVAFYAEDRYFASDIAYAKTLVQSGVFRKWVKPFDEAD